MDQVIRYAQNPEKTTEASRKKLHEIEGIVDYVADDLKTERCTYPVQAVPCIQRAGSADEIRLGQDEAEGG